MLNYEMKSLDTRLDKNIKDKINYILSASTGDREKINAISMLTSDQIVLTELRIYLEQQRANQIFKCFDLAKGLYNEFYLVLKNDVLNFDQKSDCLAALVPTEFTTSAMEILTHWHEYRSKVEAEEEDYKTIIKHQLLCPIFDEYPVLKLIELETLRTGAKALIKSNEIDELNDLLTDSPVLKECQRFMKYKKIEDEFLKKLPHENKGTLAAILRETGLHDNEKNLLFKHALLKKEQRKMANAARKEIANIRDDYLYDEEQLRKRKELIRNINSLPDVTTLLLLGQSGAGKSTFINALANHLQHLTMEEAKGKVQVLISVSFNHIELGDKEKGEPVKVIPIVHKVAGSTERSVTGEAGTVDVKIYEFKWSVAGTEKKIRLIDTPGIADPKGVSEDLLNLKKIFTALSQGEPEINGICLLLKKDTRWTDEFRYVITELFSRLPQAALSNLLFCFTKTRENQYRPGETLNILKEFVSEHQLPIMGYLNKTRIFCFDNECFRFLCAWEKVAFDPDHVAVFNSSWKQASNNYFSLFESLKSIKAHNLAYTLTLENARNFLNKICETITAVLEGERVARNNIQNCQNQIENADRRIENIKNARTEWSTERASIEDTHTVCGKCVEPDPYSSEVRFKMLCHEKCDCNLGIKKEINNIARIQKCSCFEKTIVETDKGKTEDIICKVCKCHFGCHMQISYELKHIKKLELRNEDEIKIQEQEQIKEKALNNISNQEAFINKSKIEIEYLNKCADVFAAYLNKNAIAPYNTAVSSYIDKQIANLQRSTADEVTYSTEDIRKLQHIKEVHSQMEIVMKRSTGEPKSQDELNNYMNELKKSSKKQSINLVLRLENLNPLVLQNNASVPVKSVDIGNGWLGF